MHLCIQKKKTLIYFQLAFACDAASKQFQVNSKTARNMLTWSHYRFKTQLMNKAREYPNCRVIICGEEYTSQTCSECGYLHRKIGGSNAQDVIRNLIKTLMQLEIFY
jgi:transposase